jgi:hypothetical protein
VGLFPAFLDDCWFSTGHFADVMMGFGRDAEASSCHAFYRTGGSLIVTFCNDKIVAQCQL